MKKLLTSVIFAIFLSSCSILNTGTSALNVLNTVSGLAYYYDNGDVVNFLGQAPLSEVELKQVTNSLDLLEESRIRLTGYQNDPVALVANANTIALDYMKIKIAYLNIRQIAINHQSDYSVEAWQIMEMFDILATQLDVQFQQFLSDTRTSEAVNSAVMMAGTVMRFAAVL